MARRASAMAKLASKAPTFKAPAMPSLTRPPVATPLGRGSPPPAPFPRARRYKSGGKTK